MLASTVHILLGIIAIIAPLFAESNELKQTQLDKNYFVASKIKSQRAYSVMLKVADCSFHLSIVTRYFYVVKAKFQYAIWFEAGLKLV